jgi:putative phage-type endonuclease
MPGFLQQLAGEAGRVGEMIDRNVWLAARKTGIGGSDAAVVMGLNPWKSADALWLEKTGAIESDYLADNEAVEWGNLLEIPVAQKYESVTGRRVGLAETGEGLIMKSPDYPWMIGTPDRLIFKQEGLPLDVQGAYAGVLEIKTTGAHHASDWADEPPVHYQVQLQHYLAITELKLGSFAVLIGGQKFHWRDVERNDRFIAYMIEREEAFWDCVQRDIPPSQCGFVDSTTGARASTAEALARLYANPDENAEPVILGFAFVDKAERRRELNRIIKEAEAEKLGLDNEIKSAIGEAVIGLLPDGSGFSWKKQHRDSYTVAASDYRVLREIKTKKKG